jgi:diadenosine tetraphosphatase ApaH/serine/threonine PP2A family protein phosphatase
VLRGERYAGTVRVAVLSDIHSNIVALEAVLGSIDSVDADWHLGDVVGYGAEPNEVVARLEGIDALGVRGNHDAAAIGALGVEWFNPEARRAMEWTMEAIGGPARAWLASLPERRSVDDVRLVHASQRDPTWEYITNAAVARANLEAVVADAGRIGLHGHTHVPIAFRDADGRLEMIAPAEGSTLPLDGRPVLLNPGSVGQPRDGLTSASWLELDLDADTATWRRVAYDVAAAQASIRAARLPDRLADRLAFGI